MMKLIEIAETVGITSEVTAAGQKSYPNTAWQWENLASGSSTDVDFILEARLDSAFGWQSISSQETVQNDAGGTEAVDLDVYSDVRIRVVNNDDTNAADVVAELHESP